jgi:hypothetical protein
MRTRAAKRVHYLPLATAFAIFLNTFRPRCASCRQLQPHKIMDILPGIGFFSITTGARFTSVEIGICRERHAPAEAVTGSV